MLKDKQIPEGLTNEPDYISLKKLFSCNPAHLLDAQVHDNDALLHVTVNQIHHIL